MNESARTYIENALTNLREAKNSLGKASSNAENGSVKQRIEEELTHVESCLNHCEGIASGLAQQ